jgi:hypothetical protein
MANAAYPLFLQALLDGDADVDDGDLRVIGANTTGAGTLYTYSAAHDFLDDVPAGSRVAVSATIANTTVTSGVLDGDDTTLSGTGGDSIEALILYLHTGTESTSRLVAYLDTGIGGLPYTPPGGAWSVDVVWDSGANKILKLG